MADRIRFLFTYLWKIVRIHIRSQMSYRVSFMFELIGTFMVGILEFAAFALVLDRFENIGGWQLGQVAFLAGMSNLAFGLMDMFFSGFDPRNFGRQIRLGRLDNLLLLPVNITLQVFGSEFILRRIGRILVGIFILIFSVSLVDIAWSADKIIMMLLALLGQILFFGSLFIIGATITFWTVESIELINIFTYGGSEMISYPMHIYPVGLRRFFTFVLPAIFLNYYPTLYILGLPDPLNMPAFAPWMALPAGLLMLFVAFLIWQFGLQHYQSTGT